MAASNGVNDSIYASNTVGMKAMENNLLHLLRPYADDACAAGRVPSDEECAAWLEERDVPIHICDHSKLVARVATCVATAARDAGQPVDVQAVRASALLHDVAKGYTIMHGGNHAQLGAVWVHEYTDNPLIAQGVLYHVGWPFELDLAQNFLAIAVCYADKRVRHDEIVTVDERFADLLERYGTTPQAREYTRIAHERAQRVEAYLRTYTGADFACASFS